MDFKIEIKCLKCSCKFELCSSFNTDTEFLSCPNCGQKIPADICQNLRVGIRALSEIPEVYEESQSSKETFSFTVKEWSEVNELFKL